MARFGRLLAGAVLVGSAEAQQVGKQQREVHPQIWTEECSARGCSYEKSEVVLDANWRWYNKAGKNCYMDDNTWDPTHCPDGR
eukprot:15134755-Alexandrium_andersonii.AAC.1